MVVNFAPAAATVVKVEELPAEKYCLMSDNSGVASYISLINGGNQEAVTFNVPLPESATRTLKFLMDVSPAIVNAVLYNTRPVFPRNRYATCINHVSV